MSTPKPPKFQRPNLEGAKSKSKIVRIEGHLARIIASIETPEGKSLRLMYPTGGVMDRDAAWVGIGPAREGDEQKFNAAYQRHLRKLDADKIKHPKK